MILSAIFMIYQLAYIFSTREVNKLPIVYVHDILHRMQRNIRIILYDGLKGYTNKWPGEIGFLYMNINP